MNDNPLIRVTKIFPFEMAHALIGYDGDCKNIHGHSYKLHVTLIGKPIQKEGHPKNGMVLDFKQLKAIVKEKIISKYDHALVLNSSVKTEVSDVLKRNYEKVILADYQPTCELMLANFVNQIIPELPDHLRLTSMKLYETETSFAEWVQSDNWSEL